MTAAVALAVWEWAVRGGLLAPLFFPAPSTIIRTFVRLTESGELIMHVSATLSRVFLGLLLGGAPGLIVGLLMGWSRWLRVVLDPFIAAAHPVPKIAILPLLMIIFGIGETSKLVVVGIATFFPMAINAMAGVRQISPIHFEVAKNYGASPIKIFSRVVVPGSLPMILAGARLAMNMALLITIAVELVSAQEGLGAKIWLSWETFQTEHLYASLAVIVALGISFNLIIKLLTARLIAWQRAYERVE
jgi:NitT/TauT family transport system permease protein